MKTVILLALVAVAASMPTDGDQEIQTTVSPQGVDKEQSCLDHRALGERNKKIVMSGYQELYGDHDIESADKYFHKDLIQHNPYEADGVEGLKSFARTYTKLIPKGQIDFKKISADGELVWTHVKFPAPGGKFFAAMDVFKVKDGMIVEHWDVLQRVPELKDSKNPHPLF